MELNLSFLCASNEINICHLSYLLRFNLTKIQTHLSLLLSSDISSFGARSLNVSSTFAGAALPMIASEVGVKRECEIVPSVVAVVLDDAL